MTEDIKKTGTLIREQLDLQYRGNNELQCLPASSSSLSLPTTPTRDTQCSCSCMSELSLGQTTITRDCGVSLPEAYQTCEEALHSTMTCHHQ